ncbi:MAG: hypothetical protein HFI90_10575 [Clostridia bacterium]|nr:hypothetical protein [Clostridia bacterium]
MSYLSERIAYLRGLSEGMGIPGETNEGKMIEAIIDFLDDMVEEVQMSQDMQKEFMEQMAEALELEDDELDDIEYFDVTCNQCGEVFAVDEDMLQKETIQCPNCGEEIDIQIEEDFECGGECSGCHDCD